MAAKNDTATLINADAEDPKDALGDGVSGDEWSIQRRRLSGGLSEGVDVITFNNGRLELEILPTRGMGIYRGMCDGIRLGWDSPVPRPVNPSFIDLTRRGGLGWLDGFNEFLCRCGLTFHGAPGTDVLRDDMGNKVGEEELTLHGRIANLPAHRVDASEEGNTLSVTGIVDQCSMYGERLQLTSRVESMKGSNEFRVVDTIKNLGGNPTEIEMLYHSNIGSPILEGGSYFAIPLKEMCPRNDRAAEDVDHWNSYLPPTPGYTEQVYFVIPQPDANGNGLAVLTNKDQTKALSIRFPVEQLPVFTLWKSTEPQASGYVTGLEPGSSFPNLRTFERKHGRVRKLAPGATMTFELTYQVHSDANAVKSVLSEVDQVQAGVPPLLLPEPSPELSSG